MKVTLSITSNRPLPPVCRRRGGNLGEARDVAIEREGQGGVLAAAGQNSS